MDGKTKFRIYLFGGIIAAVVLFLLFLRSRNKATTFNAQSPLVLNLSLPGYPASRYTIDIPDPIVEGSLEIGPLILNLVQHPIEFVLQFTNYIVKSPDINLGDFLVEFKNYTVPVKDIKPIINNPPSDCGCTGNPADIAKALF